MVGAEGVVRRPGGAVRPAVDGPGHRGAPLCPGDLRGHEGVPDRRRRGGPVPAGGQRRPVRRLRQADGDAPAAGAALPGVATSADRGGPRVGAHHR